MNIEQLSQHGFRIRSLNCHRRYEVLISLLNNSNPKSLDILCIQEPPPLLLDFPLSLPVSGTDFYLSLLTMKHRQNVLFISVNISPPPPSPKSKFPIPISQHSAFAFLIFLFLYLIYTTPLILLKRLMPCTHTFKTRGQAQVQQMRSC